MNAWVVAAVVICLVGLLCAFVYEITHSPNEDKIR